MENAEYLRKFSELDDIEIADTYTLHIIQESQQIESFLNSFDLDTLTELESLELKILADEWVKRMNDECPYLGQEVSVTGEVIAATYEEFMNELSISTVNYTNHTVISDGFRVLVNADEEGKRRYMTGHYFRAGVLPPRAGGPALTDSITRLYSFASVGSVDIVSDVPANRHAGVLYKSIPDIIEGVNYEIGQANDEADALCRLRRVVIDNIAEIPDATINDLLNYTYDSLGMDEAVPYLATIRGAVYQGELGKRGGLAFSMYDNDSQPVLVSPVELRLSQYPKRVGGGYTLGDDGHFIVKLRLISENKNDHERTILAPVRNIKSMRSLRHGLAESRKEVWHRA
jgi:hypothetical protein